MTLHFGSSFRSQSVLAILLAFWVLAPSAGCQTPEARRVHGSRAARLLADPASLSNPDELPEAKARHSVVFRGKEGQSQFNLHSYLAYFDKKFWAMWSSSRIREEDPDQSLRYATSVDGHHWSEARPLADDPDGPDGPARWIARGLFVVDGKLNALGALVESADYSKRGRDVVWKDLRLMRFEWDGKKWQPRGVLADDCMNNFPPGRVGGLWMMPCRDSRMNVYMAASRTLDPSGWKRTPVASEPPFHRMDEPSWYEAPDGTVHLIIRDNAKSGFLIRAVSRDCGKSWEMPVLTNYPDATSKNFAGRLSSGVLFLINNPNQKQRDPLAISFSKDGWLFGNPVAVRRQAAPSRYGRQNRTTGSFQYPHAIEQNGSIWVIYSTNKEDIEVSELPLRSLRMPAR